MIVSWHYNPMIKIKKNQNQETIFSKLFPVYILFSLLLYSFWILIEMQLNSFKINSLSIFCRNLATCLSQLKNISKVSNKEVFKRILYETEIYNIIYKTEIYNIKKHNIVFANYIIKKQLHHIIEFRGIHTEFEWFKKCLKSYF